jgi:hypothetical protein
MMIFRRDRTQAYTQDEFFAVCARIQAADPNFNCSELFSGRFQHPRGEWDMRKLDRRAKDAEATVQIERRRAQRRAS